MITRGRMSKIDKRHLILSYKNGLLSDLMNKNQLGINFQKFSSKFDEELTELLKLLEER